MIKGYFTKKEFDEAVESGLVGLSGKEKTETKIRIRRSLSKSAHIVEKLPEDNGGRMMAVRKVSADIFNALEKMGFVRVDEKGTVSGDAVREFTVCEDRCYYTAFSVNSIERSLTLYSDRKSFLEGVGKMISGKDPDIPAIGFTKDERSTFPYWFAHWSAYQMTALLYRKWKPRYLLHDWYKPWMRLFMEYKDVQKYHRTHARHHVEYYLEHGPEKTDWEGMVIDWECSMYTKKASPMNAAKTFDMEIRKLKADPGVSEYKIMIFIRKVSGVLLDFGMITYDRYMEYSRYYIGSCEN